MTTIHTECCVCYNNINPTESIKFWECDNHFTCRQCGQYLKNCPLCRAPTGKYIPRSCVSILHREIREDWKEEAIKKGLWNSENPGIIDDNCIIESWNTEGRSITTKKHAYLRNKQDIRLTW